MNCTPAGNREETTYLFNKFLWIPIYAYDKAFVDSLFVVRWVVVVICTSRRYYYNTQVCFYLNFVPVFGQFCFPTNKSILFFSSSWSSELRYYDNMTTKVVLQTSSSSGGSNREGILHTTTTTTRTFRRFCLQHLLLLIFLQEQRRFMRVKSWFLQDNKLSFLNF